MSSWGTPKLKYRSKKSAGPTPRRRQMSSRPPRLKDDPPTAASIGGNQRQQFEQPRDVRLRNARTSKPVIHAWVRSSYRGKAAAASEAWLVFEDESGCVLRPTPVVSHEVRSCQPRQTRHWPATEDRQEAATPPPVPPDDAGRIPRQDRTQPRSTDFNTEPSSPLLCLPFAASLLLSSWPE